MSATVPYVRFDDERVSKPWDVVLRAAVAAGIITEADLNDGHRTMAEQQDRVDAQGVWSLANPHGAAKPSATAPHIRLGRVDHAIDVQATNGAAGRMAAWLRKLGARASFTVPGEPWHIEVPLADLERLAEHLADPLADYTAAERRWIREYDQLRRANRDRGRRRVLRRYMTAQRKRIHRAATPGGWDIHNRRARYASLLARTR